MNKQENKQQEMKEALVNVIADAVEKASNIEILTEMGSRFSIGEIGIDGRRFEISIIYTPIVTVDLDELEAATLN